MHINDTVKVRLTQQGKQYLQDQHDMLFANLPLHRKPAFKLPTEDAEGYCKFQLWILFKDFSAYFNSPQFFSELPFQAEIEIVDRGNSRSLD
ncbi:hypothetical protein [Aliterella atlantica]|nr:hypothetical protein [Aliterella atlantica]